MSDITRGYGRIRRRETHASRSTSAVVVAIVLIAALAWLVVEIVLAAAGQQPLLLSPAGMVEGIAALGGVPVGWLWGAGAVLAVLGLVLLGLGLGRGRRPRHVLPNDRAVVVVDDEVIASALVRAAADADGIDPDRAVSSISRRTAVVRVTPTSGVPVQRDRIAEALGERLQQWGLAPSLRSRVQIQKAKVGA
ncbi:hypothetical protein [Amnibacterium endophyticum]|uniref:DNA/RNA endonuclease G n=1 Tax=Amnibacterium endophyticum TaxID=2109337 RepID=A0ABW4LGK6_9MICO